MDVIYGLIPGMILLGLVAVGVFFWAAKSGQFDDMEGEAHRILMDEDLVDEEPAAPEAAAEKGASSTDPSNPDGER
ncbi:cbb3-type cytochrome oxidase assembly protein CcoS [Motiliproteus sp. SC1-56]|uniref:cbb3-type cytochrome oxidase assembly protein CcoS n=1 Tax=Motiliproteus sp. SC1-56 TaxID=2799565 RepID=UPI001A8F8278|nr:cbb3-type cytochrome oxidase assembly protein CcoS [Motiliproteus sp. SC1-56]